MQLRYSGLRFGTSWPVLRPRSVVDSVEFRSSGSEDIYMRSTCAANEPLYLDALRCRLYVAGFGRAERIN
jgi:hypothetical protein